MDTAAWAKPSASAMLARVSRLFLYDSSIAPLVLRARESRALQRLRPFRRVRVAREAFGVRRLPPLWAGELDAAHLLCRVKDARKERRLAGRARRGRGSGTILSGLHRRSWLRIWTSTNPRQRCQKKKRPGLRWQSGYHATCGSRSGRRQKRSCRPYCDSWRGHRQT